MPDKIRKPFELMHTDIWGPAPLISRDGYKYYISIVDDFTRYTWIFLLNDKAQTTNIFIKFKELVENQTDYKIKCVQSDWGGEFRPLRNYLQTQAINFRHPCPYTSHQNGRIE